MQVPDINNIISSSSGQFVITISAWLTSHWYIVAALAASVMLVCMAAVLLLRYIAAKPIIVSSATSAATTNATAATTATDTDTGSTSSQSSSDAASLNSVYIDIVPLDISVTGSIDRTTVDSTAAAAAVSSSLFWDVMNVLLERQAVPQELWCVSKFVDLLVRDSMPITVNIAAGTSAATMQSLLDRESVQHVHIDGHNMQPDVIAAIEGTLHPDSPMRRLVPLAHTLWRSSSVESFSLVNFQQQQWDTIMVKRLLEQVPDTVHTLHIALPEPRRITHRWFNCPQTVRALSIRHFTWSLYFDAQPHLDRLQIAGDCRRGTAIPQSVRTIVFTDVNILGVALLPRLPDGLVTLDLSESGIVRPNDIPRIPATVTDIRWPHGYVQPAAVPHHAQWHGVQGDLLV
jgi:hypothetical protein